MELGPEPRSRHRSGLGTRMVAGLAVVALAVAAGSAAGLLLTARARPGRGALRVDTSASPSPGASVSGGSSAGLQAVAQEDLPEIVTVVAVGAQTEELGTGWPMDGHGDFITNDHVVGAGLSFHVITSSGIEYPARVINSDPPLDLAEVQAVGLDEAPLALATAPATVGEPVVVLASQGATGHSPVTVSLVNALNQRASVDDAQPGQLSDYTGLIRIPAHIYAGNSGGPVLSSSGQVVGILTLAAKFGTGAFAIPMAELGPVIRQWLRA